MDGWMVSETSTCTRNLHNREYALHKLGNLVQERKWATEPAGGRLTWGLPCVVGYCKLLVKVKVKVKLNL